MPFKCTYYIYAIKSHKNERSLSKGINDIGWELGFPEVCSEGGVYTYNEHFTQNRLVITLVTNNRCSFRLWIGIIFLSAQALRWRDKQRAERNRVNCVLGGTPEIKLQVPLVSPLVGKSYRMKDRGASHKQRSGGKQEGGGRNFGVFSPHNIYYKPAKTQLSFKKLRQNVFCPSLTKTLSLVVQCVSAQGAGVFLLTTLSPTNQESALLSLLLTNIILFPSTPTTRTRFFHNKLLADLSNSFKLIN